MTPALLFLALATIVGARAEPSRTILVPRIGTSGARAPATLIVGRAGCGSVTFLLTDSLQLVEVSPGALALTVRSTEGFGPGERPWGLACLDDGSLWTMADPNELAQLGRDGRVVGRVAVRPARVALFGIGDRLLYQELPLRVGAPALATSRPRRPGDEVPWPGLRSRRAGSREDELTRNLVTCGMPHGGSIPCWFADEDRVLVSSGAHVQQVDLEAIRPALADPMVPLWDVALVDDGAWVLGTAGRPEAGHRVGGRLFRLDSQYRPRAWLDLAPAARLLVGASADRCVLLSVDGRLMEVTVR